MKFGIIGSAGRKEDGDKFNRENYIEASRIILSLIQEHPKVDTLVSGGSAFIDHLAIRYFNRGLFKNLILHAPAEWDYKKTKFNDSGKFDWRTNPGGTINYYHQKFSQKVGINSLEDIKKAIYSGFECKFIVTPGLMERNTKVAEDADYLVAASWG